MTNAAYHRKGFGLKSLVEQELKAEYESALITQLRTNNNTLSHGRITIRLADAFGFCWGVDRAVSMAYETREQFPSKRVWITNEIIHNPVVNENLRKKDIQFIPFGNDGKKDFSEIGPDDVVILPAFGASVEELKSLESNQCQIVDTTCPWVSRVWNRVAKYEGQEFTAIIHGKYKHEETVATASRSHHYLIVQSLEEAKWICNYILYSGDRLLFFEKFREACSADFDPDLHLIRVGIANQTTMLKSETELIGKLFERTMLTKYGPDKLNNHFLSPGDTICDATQERQDAMLKLVEGNIDLMLVIGGFNSSNTGHLQEIAQTRGLRSFHIDGSGRIGPGNLITHKGSPSEGLIETKNWLPRGPLTIGITSGASTPDQVVAEVIEKTFLLAETEDTIFA